MPELPDQAPRGAATSTLRYRVPFFDTDAMGVVHHANYVRYLELARIQLLDEHDVPYREYVARDLHFAVTDVRVEYRHAARFDDALDVTCWVDWVRGASLGIGYALRCGDALVARARTSHAMVDAAGRAARIPAERRAQLRKLVGG